MSGKLSRTVLRRGKRSNPFPLVDYASHDYQYLLENNGFVQSMSAKGCCYDNTCAESFFSFLKKDKLYECKFKTRFKARMEVVEYIELFYNSRRLHSTLEYKSPKEYKKDYFLKLKTTL